MHSHVHLTSCFLLQQSTFSKQTGWHPILAPRRTDHHQTSKPFPFPFNSSFCSKVSFQWQATGYQLLGASPAATPPSASSIPPLFSLQLLRAPVADGKIRHHDTNKLSPYFKKAHWRSVFVSVCACMRESVCVWDTTAEESDCVCMHSTHVCVYGSAGLQQNATAAAPLCAEKFNAVWLVEE